VSDTKSQSDWARLFRIACALIRQVNTEQLLIDHWTFGGGTAMMLQIGHRESRDVDIFLSDAQLLPLLDPEKHDFQFEIQPAAHQGDGAGFQKFAFDKIGEIDFIVGSALTSLPTKWDFIEGENVLLETIPEIITKKIHYRGASIKPRDIFDIAAAGEQYADSLIKELKAYRDEVARTLTTIDKLKPDFVNRAIAQLSIKDGYAAIAKTAIERTKEILQAV
jgi:Nucleotidyl transferase AbiEii toxin, Type IV TA system